MTTWITNNIQLKQPFIFEHEDTNVVILGKLTSNYDISFKVNNLIVLGGSIVTTQNLSIHTKTDLFNIGKIFGNNLEIKGGNQVYNGIDEIGVQKIRALGIDLTLTPTGKINFNVPDNH